MPGRYDVSFLASLSAGSVLHTTMRRSPIGFSLFEYLQIQVARGLIKR